MYDLPIAPGLAFVISIIIYSLIIAVLLAANIALWKYILGKGE